MILVSTGSLAARRRSRSLLVVVTLVMVVAALIAAVSDGAIAADDFFVDDEDSVHEADINAIAALGITRGCNPPARDRFCPKDPLTREQMAAFVVRTMELTAGSGADLFTDDDDSIFENDIDRLGTAGITKGCNPPANTLFCPTAKLTRAQMASFIRRALDLDAGGKDFFGDDELSIHEADINAIAAAGITKGCNPPANTRFCPESNLTREQMATFLIRMVRLLIPELVAIGDQAMPENAFLTVPISVLRPEDPGDPERSISLSTTGLPSFGALSDNGDGTGSLGFAPGFADSGTYSITVTATRMGRSDSTSFKLVVTGVNRSPTLSAVSDQSSGEGSAISLSLDADDVDGDVLAFAASGLPAGLSIDTGTGEISGAVGFGAAASSPYNVTVSVTDSIAPPVARSFTWTIVDTNRNPVLGPIADRENLEGDAAITLDLGGLASDPDGDALSFSATGLPLGLTISPVGLITGDLAVGDGGTYPVTVTVTDDGAPTLTTTRSFAWEVFGPDATLTVTESVGSTIDAESMVLVNDSRGAVTIESIAIDLSTAVYPDMVWDPNGTGGDVGWRCLTATAVSAATVGFVPGSGSRPCDQPFFSGPHDGGFDVLTIEFGDFDPGEEFRFWTDSDPTSIQGGDESGQGGNVNGAELTGATVTIMFSSGVIVTELFQVPGSATAARAIAGIDSPGSTPSISLPAFGGTLSAASWNASHPGSVVEVGATTDVDHIVRATGPEGAVVRLLVFGSVLNLEGGPGFEVEPFEANARVAIQAYEGTISGGSVDFDVELIERNRLFYMIATVRNNDGDDATPDQTGRTSNIVVLRQDGGNAEPSIDPVPAQSDVEGTVVSLQLSASDPDPGQTLAWAVVQAPGFDPLPSGLNLSQTGLISGTIGAGTAGTYAVKILVTDDHPTYPLSSSETFVWSVAMP